MKYKAFKSLYDVSKANRRKWDSTLADAFKFVRPMSLDKNTRGGKGKTPVDVYDSTAAVAFNERVASLTSQLFPAFTSWVQLRRPHDGASDVMDNIAEAERRINAAIGVSNFSTEIDQVIAEACISVGAMLIKPGDSERPLVFEALSLDNLIPQNSDDGVIRTVFFDFKFTKTELQRRYSGFKSFKLPDGLLKGKDNGEYHDVIEGYVYNYEKKKTELMVTLGDNVICGYEYDGEPIICCREGKANGEVMGRGRVINALPDIRTLNEFHGLNMENAGRAVKGLYQVDDDGVINVSKISTLEPGHMIVKSPYSKGIQPIPSATPFDLTAYTLNDLQEKVRRGIKGVQISPDLSRTNAMAVNLQLQERLQSEMPSGARILDEMFYRMVKRIVSILKSPAFADSEFYIGNLVDGVDIVPASPAKRIQVQQKIAGDNAVVGNLLQLFGENVLQIVDVEGLVKYQMEEQGLGDYVAEPQQPAPVEQMAEMAAAMPQAEAMPIPEGGL